MTIGTAPDLLQAIQKGKVKAPRRTLLYGVHGVGKSTFGSMADNPIFIPTEDGLADIDCDHFPLAQKYQDVLNALYALYTEKHDYHTVVIDSLDWLEQMIGDVVCAKRGIKSMEDVGYRKAFVYAMTQWREVIEGLNALRNDCSMSVILIAHAQIKTFNNPETEPYDRYMPKLDKNSSALVQEWCDEVLFATYKVNTRQVDKGFDKKHTMGIGKGERILRTTERPTHLAKNRLSLPDEIPFDHRIYAAFVRGENPLANTQPTTEGV